MECCDILGLQPLPLMYLLPIDRPAVYLLRVPAASTRGGVPMPGSPRSAGRGHPAGEGEAGRCGRGAAGWLRGPGQGAWVGVPG
jgi:hypothetical protein